MTKMATEMDVTRLQKNIVHCVSNISKKTISYLAVPDSVHQSIIYVV